MRKEAWRGRAGGESRRDEGHVLLSCFVTQGVGKEGGRVWGRGGQEGKDEMDMARTGKGKGGRVGLAGYASREMLETKSGY